MVSSGSEHRITLGEEDGDMATGFMEAWIRWTRDFPRYYQLGALISMYGFGGGFIAPDLRREIDRIMAEINGYEAGPHADDVTH